MKLYLFCFLFVVVSCSSSKKAYQKDKTEISTYYLIRHAEKDKTDPSNNNPHLTDKGLARAKKWRQIFRHIKFDHVYSTSFNRTKETALPTANKNNVDITFYNPRNIDVKSFIDKTKGKTVLIVGHSNTTPMLANAIIGKEKYKQINETNNGNLYTITIINSKISDQVLTIN